MKKTKKRKKPDVRISLMVDGVLLRKDAKEISIEYHYEDLPERPNRSLVYTFRPEEIQIDASYREESNSGGGTPEDSIAEICGEFSLERIDDNYAENEREEAEV